MRGKAARMGRRSEDLLEEAESLENPLRQSGQVL